MLPMPAGPASPSPGGPAPGASPAGVGQPPFGPQSVQAPTPNRGNEVAALGKLTWATRTLESILPMVGASSELGKSVLKALNALSKHAPEGGVPPAMQNNALSDLMQKQRQMSPVLAALQSQGQAPGQAQQPEPPGAPPGQPGVM